MDIENQFVCGRPLCTWWRISEKVFVLQESADGPLVVLQRFNKPGGWYVTVNCIAPCAPGVGEFSYELSYGTPMGGYKHIMTFKSSEMNRIHKVSFQTPEKDFMLIPHYFQYPRNSLKMTICIKKDMKEEGED
ncbi:E3 ubiquitin-protein ligase SINA-like 2 [Capsella rubella]|nr:E3 ubiquitin-protein ligase SINA-like 2 [Capsella rubella]